MEELLKSINEKKEASTNFKHLLDELENLYNSGEMTILEKIQIATYLGTDYYYEEEYNKSLKFAIEGINLIEDVLSTMVLETDSMIFTIILLEKCVLLKIRIQKNDDLAELNKLKEYKFYKLIKKHGKEIVKYGIECFNQTNEIKYLICTAEYATDRLHFEDILEMFYRKYKVLNTNEILNFMEALKGLKEDTLITYNLLIFYSFTDNINKVRNSIISKRNKLEELYKIALICIKTNKIDVLKLIIEDLLKLKGMFSEEEILTLKQNYTIAYEYETGIPIFENFINWKELIEFYFNTKNYKLINEILLDNKEIKKLIEKEEIKKDIFFISLIETENLKEAEKMYERELALRYTPQGDESLFCGRVSKYTFRLFMKRNKFTSALNILKRIEIKEDFVDCIKLIYNFNKFDILVEGIIIGIKKYGTENINLIQIFVSLIHLEDVKITHLQRAELLNQIIKSIDYLNLNASQRRWFYDVCYNNILDLIYSEENVIYELLDSCYSLIGVELDIIYLSLNIKQSIRINIDWLYDEFIKLKKDMQNMSLYMESLVLFYEAFLSQNNEGKVEEIFKEIQINTLEVQLFIKLLNSDTSNNHKYFNIKTKIINESINRFLLTEEIFDRNIINSSFFGPMNLYNFFMKCEENISISKIYNLIGPNGKLVINNQLEVAKIHGSIQIVHLFEEILNLKK
ncbi:hypothetical protein TCON_2322 [Astathelohania contejeani]|uniref:Uncharacterized protein n=1 Tax=Astathelohania contejeani TaxID=164912 RepID=A0ABQ7HWB3_9MICR|nr:hypothetical protein TCON_2322 [Thelohania contejeani]